jgi:uncharacterized protein (DUF433 family)
MAKIDRDDIHIAPGILANWAIHSGSPCIKGTRLATFVIVGRFSAGDSVAHLADDYRVTAGEIEAAIRYEYLRRRDRKPEFRARAGVE